MAASISDHSILIDSNHMIFHLVEFGLNLKLFYLYARWNFFVLNTFLLTHFYMHFALSRYDSVLIL